MKIFLSWSGERSRLVAAALRTWLNDTLHQIQPWMSSEDIVKGARWSLDLVRELDGTNIGIVCLTRENLNSPWILFESGALSKALDNSRVCTFLYGLRASDMEGPLVQFQATLATEKETRQLLHSINQTLPASEQRAKDQIDRAFDKWWPDLKKSLDAIPSHQGDLTTIRSERELLEEILNLARLHASKMRESALQGQVSNVLSLDSIFQDEQLHKLLLLVPSQAGSEDKNAATWFGLGGMEDNYSSIDGKWFSRWNSPESSPSWRVGHGTVQQTARFVAIWYVDDLRPHAPYLIIAHVDNKERLFGRYFNLTSRDDVGPWAGMIVDNRRIDGWWRLGRWDFRR